MKKTMVFIILFVILMLNINKVKGENFDFEHNYAIIHSGEYTSYFLHGNKGDEIHIIIESNKSVNCYIVEDPFDSNIIPSSEKLENISDYIFNNAEFTKENKSEFDFKWTLPTNKNYMIVIYNPYNYSASFSIKYTYPTWERIRWIFNFLILVTVVIIAIILFILYNRIRKKQFQNPPPP